MVSRIGLRKMTRRAVLILVAFAFAALSVRASEPVPVPRFGLKAVDGSVVASDTVLPTDGRWLVAYVQANCRACERLMTSIGKADPEFPLKLVVIVDGSAAAANELQKRFPDLSDATFYLDADHAAWTALKITGVPMLFGVQDRTIRWTLSGVLASDDQVKAIISGWGVE